MVTQILGLYGPIGSGKTYIASQLSDNHKIFRYSFATPLKNVVRDLFSVPYSNLWGTQEQKEMFSDVKKSRSPETYYTYRELLQEFGSLCRKLDENVFVNLVMRQICNHGGMIILDDVRFNNEIEAIRKNGGKVIKLTGRGGSNSTHESETELTNRNDFDGIYDNSGSFSRERFLNLLRELNYEI